MKLTHATSIPSAFRTRIAAALERAGGAAQADLAKIAADLGLGQDMVEFVANGAQKLDATPSKGKDISWNQSDGGRRIQYPNEIAELLKEPFETGGGRLSVNPRSNVAAIKAHGRARVAGIKSKFPEAIKSIARACVDNSTMALEPFQRPRGLTVYDTNLWEDTTEVPKDYRQKVTSFRVETREIEHDDVLRRDDWQEFASSVQGQLDERESGFQVVSISGAHR